MSTQLIGGPHDGLRWQGPTDPEIHVDGERYVMRDDGRYHHEPERKSTKQAQSEGVDEDGSA